MIGEFPPSNASMFTARVLIALALLLPICSFAERVDQLPSPLPGSHVADPTGLLAADTRAELDRLAATLDGGGRGQLGFAVVASTEGVDPRRFATQVFNRWGIGDAKRKDGTLILLAKQDRAAEIVLGDGIDTPANRTHAERVMQEAMVPRFRDGNYDQALVAGATQLLQRIYAVDLSRPTEQPQDAVLPEPQAAQNPAFATNLSDASSPSSNAAPAADFATSVDDVPTTDSAPPAPHVKRPVVIYTEPTEPTPPGIMALGFSVLAGGAAALLWLIQRILRMLWWFTGSRWLVRKCKNCSTKMQMLSEVADDAHLADGQRTEERLGSVDHRVYLCPRCNHVDHIARRAWFTRYADCSACYSRALSSVSKTLSSATRYSTGLAEVTDTCQHCGKVKVERRVLPVLPPPSSSSSSSSSSGRSFGGGSSSGGGASGRW